MAVQALIAAGYSDDDEVINNAINYIKSMQFEDGGWGDSSTTAFVLMTLNALDEPTESWYSESKKVPLSNLFSFQKTNGAFLYTWEYPDDNLMSTASALLALFDGDYIIEPHNVSTINLASVFIIPDEGVVYADCVEFEEASISGLALLESSDFSYKSEEGFINSIMEVSNPEEETNYWSYWAWDGREWKFKNTGPGESIVLPGSVEAWYFTSWEVFPSLPPTFVPAEDQLCEIAFKKSYTDQPNLDYNDLFTVESEILEAPEPTTSEPVQEEIELPQEEPTAEETDASEPDQVTSPPIEEEQEEPLSRLPIFIIISVGLVLLGVVLFFVLRKRE
jgi:hypothetical protein